MKRACFTAQTLKKQRARHPKIQSQKLVRLAKIQIRLEGCDTHPSR
jgi:hypothetical protein